MNAYPYCIAVNVSAKALTAILDNGGRGAYRDHHPWLMAEELLQAAQDQGDSAAVDSRDWIAARAGPLGGHTRDRR